MAPKTPQSFANHAQMTPMYHYVASPLAGIYTIWSVIRLFRHPEAETILLAIGAFALFAMVAVARLSPLRVQDRLIRLEEQLRYQRLLSADLAARAMATFSPRHYIALRFASDAELAPLVEKVIADPSMTGKAIKQQITTWRPDYFRV